MKFLGEFPIEFLNKVLKKSLEQFCNEFLESRFPEKSQEKYLKMLQILESWNPGIMHKQTLMEPLSKFCNQVNLCIPR